jgi:RNA polymerase sigma-70 factor, ECF subfamily
VRAWSILANFGPTRLARCEDENVQALRNEVTSLYDELHAPVYGYLIFLGMKPQEAEDVSQETFLRLYKHLHAGGNRGNLRCWLFRVAHNLSINEFKRQKYTRGVSPEVWTKVSGSTADPSPTPEAILLRKEMVNRAFSAIPLLSKQQKQCLFLRSEGLRYREIAEILGVTVSTVTESLRRAIRKLNEGSHA